MSRYDGKVAMVSGAASGMGKATAIRLASEGAKVVCGDINEEGNQETVNEIKEAGGEATAVAFNAMEEESCIAFVATAVETYGQLDVVCNVAGIGSFYKLDELTTEIFNRFIAINTTSVMVICREAMPHLVKTKGNIVNFASLNSKVMTAYQTAYCASKAAVAAVTKCLALEYVKEGVRVNAVCPGGIETPMYATMRFPEDMDFKAIKRIMPPDRQGKPEEVAALVAFLASEEAAFINGEDILIDGGTNSNL